MSKSGLATATGLCVVLCSLGCGKDPAAPPAGKKPVKAVLLPPPRTPPSAIVWCGTASCPCTPGAEKKHRSTGKLKACVFAKESVVQGRAVPAGRKVGFYPNGKLRSFVPGTTLKIDGRECRKGMEVRLHHTGKLRRCTLEKATKAGGVVCDGTAAFHPSGRLRRCTLKAAADLAGQKVPEGDKVMLDDEGRLCHWEMAEPREIGGIICKGPRAEFHPNGKLKKCKLARRAKILRKRYRKDTDLCFDRTGAVVVCPGAAAQNAHGG